MNASFATDVSSARTAFNALTPAQKGFVANLADLTEAEAGIVTDEASLTSAIANASKIFIANDITLTAPVVVNQTVSINGNGKTLTAPQAGFAGLSHNSAVVIQANDVEVTNLTVDANAATPGTWQTPARFGMQVYDATGVKLTDVTLKNGQAGLLVNAATADASVEANGVNTEGNGFGGMEVYAAAGHTATLNLVDFNQNGFASTTPAIWTEGAGTRVVDTANSIGMYEQFNAGEIYTFGGTPYTVPAGQVHYVQRFM